MRLLVIDDEQLVLEGLEAFLQAALRDVSLDKAAHAAAALRLASTFRYQLVLLDWNLADARGQVEDTRELVRQLRAGGLDGPIIIVSGEDRSDWPALLLELGLSGMVPKTAPGTALIDAIEVALRGGMYLPAPAVRQQTHAAYRRAPLPPPPPDPATRFPDLTERQAEVFREMARGQSDKQIARTLGISETTVKTHVRAILGIVGVHRRGQAVYQLSQTDRPPEHG